MLSVAWLPLHSQSPQSCRTIHRSPVPKGHLCFCVHTPTAASLHWFALLLVLRAWAKILLDVVNHPSWYVYREPRVVLGIKQEETVNRYLQQQSQKDEVEGPALVNHQHHSDSTRQFWWLVWQSGNYSLMCLLEEAARESFMYFKNWLKPYCPFSVFRHARLLLGALPAAFCKAD